MDAIHCHLEYRHLSIWVKGLLTGIAGDPRIRRDALQPVPQQRCLSGREPRQQPGMNSLDRGADRLILRLALRCEV